MGDNEGTRAPSIIATSVSPVPLAHQALPHPHHGYTEFNISAKKGINRKFPKKNKSINLVNIYI
jgi:hypothetical protein